MLQNREEICKALGIGRKRFYRYRAEADPPMPVRYDGFAYIADYAELMDWRRKYVKTGST